MTYDIVQSQNHGTDCCGDHVGCKYRRFRRIDRKSYERREQLCHMTDYRPTIYVKEFSVTIYHTGK